MTPETMVAIMAWMRDGPDRYLSHSADSSWQADDLENHTSLTAATADGLAGMLAASETQRGDTAIPMALAASLAPSPSIDPDWPTLPVLRPIETPIRQLSDETVRELEAVQCRAAARWQERGRRARQDRKTLEATIRFHREGWMGLMVEEQRWLTEGWHRENDRALFQQAQQATD